ncbi:MAG: alpha-ketoglutarate-dependent dioxygenase AlkB [Acidimicrobiales bacterium]
MSTGVLWQPSLLGCESHDVDRSFHTAVRHELTGGAWVDEVPLWCSGADSLFDDVLRIAPWGPVEQRPMYDRIVDVPRLHTGLWPSPPARLVDMAEVLSQRYDADLRHVTANLYRDGNDSVAWHGDRVGRHRAVTTVAILTLGSPRRFLLRPRGGGRPSLTFEPGPGDLVVMGGTCQRTWEHAVPKRASAGPRICVMFREPGGN